MAILDEIIKRKSQRETETVRDFFVTKLSQLGAKDETLELISNIKADSPQALTSAIKDIQDIVSKSPFGQEEEMAKKVKESFLTATASEQAKLLPEITQAKLDFRAKEKEQDLGFRAQEAFIDIQKQVLQKGVDLDASEKQKLVFAEQGAKTAKIASELLNNQNFIGAVFQQAGGTIGKLSTAGQTQLRNYNTAVESSIVSYLFANSGAQASDKEREAFRSIYGLQIGDTLENGQFKNKLLTEFFQTAKDIIDPNKVAGLSVTELNGKLNEIQQHLNKLGKGGTEEAKTIIKYFKDNALRNDFGQNDILKRLVLSPDKFEIVEE